MIEIDGSTLEGGGQIIRTALSLSSITGKEFRVFNIRKKRAQPGLKSQHLHLLYLYKELFNCKVVGDFLYSTEVIFWPSGELKRKQLYLDLKTAASIGLVLQGIIPVILFVFKEKITLELKGGTFGKWAIPVEFYPCCFFPLLGIKAEFSILRRGYYPKGGGRVRLVLSSLNQNLKSINYTYAGNIKEIYIQSIASDIFRAKEGAHKQLKIARYFLEKNLGSLPIRYEIIYCSTDSPATQINLCAYLDSGSLVWSDCLGEKNKSPELVGKEGAQKLIKELKGGACIDKHTADNLIPYLAMLGGKIKVSEITLHTRTNIWVCEKFLGNIFTIDETKKVIEVKKGFLNEK